MKDTESKTLIVSFFVFDDAASYFDDTVKLYQSEGWELEEGSGISYVNFQFRVGLKFEKEIFVHDGKGLN